MRLANFKIKMTKLALVRVRGKVRVNVEIRQTLEFLGLANVNNCVIIEDTPTYKGMVRKVNSYVTWGEVTDETIASLKENVAQKGNAKTFRLHPPKKGWERKGIKKPYNSGGALGYRGVEINSLIKRMS